MANRTIGLSRNNASNVGLEQSYDSLLKGKTGQQLVRYVAGTYLPVDGGEVEPENGKDIISTLDTYIQDVTESALMNMLVRNNSLHGTAIVMETAAGKIKAIANLGKQRDSVYTEDLNYGIGKATALKFASEGATVIVCDLNQEAVADVVEEVKVAGGKAEGFVVNVTNQQQLNDMVAAVKIGRASCRERVSSPV